MAFGILLLILSVLGIIYGIIKKNRPLVVISVLVLIITISVWIFFYYNPY